jgi:signal transduction histidine kinase
VADLASTLQWVSAGAFALLAAATVIQWRRTREPATAWLAAALSALAVVPVAGRLETLGAPAALIADLSIVGFIASGFFVLMFRSCFLPLSRFLVAGAAALATGAVLFALTLQILAPSDRTLQALVAVVLIGTWGALLSEPIARFWLASRGLPPVQRARMRSLSVGLAVLLGILLVSALGGRATRNPTGAAATQLVALAMVPVILVSFAPPSWLRRQWRSKELAATRAATQDLLIFSPNRRTLAEKAIVWAQRLVGADGALIRDSDGLVLAVERVPERELAQLCAELDRDPKQGLSPLAGTPTQSVIRVRLPLDEGPAWLVVIAGPFTPVFGADEVEQLEAYGSYIAAGLERTRVTERLAAMERLKSQFLNLASHELRGPLTVLRGYLSMLDSGQLGKLNEIGEHAVPVMVAKASEMHGLVEQMLEAARLEEGRLALNLDRHDLRDVVASAVDAVRPLVGRRHSLTVQLGKSAVPVTADIERIQTILTNLLDNAIKYSPAGGEVRVAVRCVGDCAEVMVADRGVGIADKDLPTLFTRFGRIMDPAVAHVPGTGLGLYLSRELARLHEGDLVASAVAGRGSTFTLRLPRVQPADNGKVSPPLVGGVPGGARGGEADPRPHARAKPRALQDTSVDGGTSKQAQR